MTAAQGVSAPPVPRLDPDEVGRLRVTQWRVVRSELVKMRSLRSTWIIGIIAIGSMLGIGVAIAWSTANDWNHMRSRQQARFNPLVDPMSGFNLAQLAIGVLGILLIAGEYSGGMIRASLTAVPRRLPVLWAKTAIFAVLTAVVMVPVSIATFFVSQRFLSVRHIQIGWALPHVARSVVGVGLYLTVVAVLAVGVGAVVRNIAGAIAAFVGVLLVVPVVASALPETWANRIDKWLPSNAGQAIMAVRPDPNTLSPWRGLGVFALYAIGTVALAAVLLRRRDA